MRFRLSLYISFIVSLSFFSLLQAQTWRTISAGWKPGRIATTQNGLWVSSEGGLLHLDPQKMTLDILSKDQGFLDNEISVVVTEPGDRIIWIGYPEGGLERFDTQTGKIIQRILDFHNDNEPEIFNIYDIFFYDSKAYIATDVGISQMVKSEQDNIWVVQESWHRFSTWETEATCIGINRDTILVGTKKGIARGLLTQNLIEASNWNLFPFREHFPDTLDNAENYFNYIREVDGHLYASLYRKGLYRLEGDSFSKVGNTSASYGITSNPQGELLMAHWDGLYYLNGESNRWDRYDQIDEREQKLFDVTYAFDKIWGTFDTDPSRLNTPGGIGAFDGSSWELWYSNTPGGNDIYHIEVSPQGNIWVSCGLKIEGSVKMRGVYQQVDGVWNAYSPLNTVSSVFSFITQGVGFDAFGGTWVGSRGKGMMRIAEDGSYQYFNSMDSTGARLIPYNSNDDFVLVGGFAADPSGGLWYTNPENFEEKPLGYIPASWFEDNSVPWIYFGIPEGLRSSYLSIIEMDGSGRLWLGSISGAGSVHPVYVYDPNGTPEDKSDDNCYTYNSADGVGFLSLLRIEYANDGTMWLGGPDSLYYADATLPAEEITFNPVSLPLGSRALALESDPAGNLWVGTDYGVFALNAEKQEWIAKYSSEESQYSSPLIDDKVSALCVDPVSGEMYMGTEKGISVLNTPYRNLRGEDTDLTIKPQPFFVGPDQTLKMSIYGKIMQNESLNSHVKEVKIFTASGKLIKTMNRSEASIGWDGRTDNNEWAASGVYLVVVTDDVGNSEIGKVAIVRK